MFEVAVAVAESGRKAEQYKKMARPPRGESAKSWGITMKLVGGRRRPGAKCATGWGSANRTRAGMHLRAAAVGGAVG